MKCNKFKFSELFEAQSGNTDIQQSHINNKGLFVVSAGLENNGIIGKSDVEAKIFEKNTITVDMFGNVFFRDFKYKMVTHARVFSLKYVKDNKDISVYEGLYLLSKMFWFKEKFSYNNMASWNKIKDFEISLPVKDNGEIDYEYMAERIKELMAERIKELMAYLKVTGLSDYDLTDYEKDLIERFNRKIYKSLRIPISDLFDIHPTKSYGVTNYKLFDSLGKMPVVVNSSQKNGIGGYVDRKATEKGNMITFSDTTTSEGIFYQPFDFIGYSHVQGLYAKPYNGESVKWSEKSLLFVLTLFRENAKGRFDYANKFTRKLAGEMILNLPLTNDNKIDIEFMEDYITAIEKMTIKSAVNIKDLEIEIYKKVI